MQVSKRIGLLLSLSIASAPCALADNAVLIGGGYNINGSQGQIELNVRWVQDVLKKADMPITTFFTDGDDPAPDVHYLQSNANAEQAATGERSALDQLATQLEPLARLYDSHRSNAQRFRNHQVPDVKGSTEAGELGVALNEHFKAANGDPTLIVYNGHGKQSQTTTDHVTMELWNNTKMTANELHGILEENGASSRFVFTQCYSGGFHRLAYKNPSKGLELSAAQRCGFTAESAYRLSEGCSASIDTADYRDYTTYFFAALSGRDRNGNYLPVETDTNTDGQVTLREAHFYTLGNAHSTDLSRSTSEDFLSTWQPWYLKWTAHDSGLPSNEYGKLFRDLAVRHDIPLHRYSARDVRREMATHINTIKDLTTKRQQIKSKIKSIQKNLQSVASSQWPALLGPFTASFQVMAASGELLAVSNWVEEQAEYKELLELQTQIENITDLHLSEERKLTQMQKLIEFRRLAKIKEQLYQYGSASEISSYESLVSCEDQPLNMSDKSSSNEAITDRQITEQDISD